MKTGARFKTGVLGFGCKSQFLNIGQRMKRTVGVVVVIYCVIIIAACNSTGPVAIRESIINDLSTKESQEKFHVTYPVIPESNDSDKALLNSLYKQALSSLETHQITLAIAQAEQGLRLNRADPRFYWLLAKAYSNQHDYDQAIKFVELGIRYSKENSKIYDDLHRMMQQIQR